MWAPLILQANKDKQEENAKLLNCAMDFVVNQLIKDTDPQESVCCYSDIPKPAVWLQDDKYRGWDVGAVFDDLQQNSHPQLKGSGPGGAGNGGLDQHGLMDAFNALPEHEQQKIMQQIDTAVRMGKERAKMAGANKGDLDRAMDLLASKAAEKKLDIACLMEDGLPSQFIGDVTRLRQVLVNLLDNAIKYSPDGGEVAVELAKGAGRVRLTVRDEGLGVPSGEQERIFEKFYRLDPALTRGVGGSGLGLFISRELVTRMGGSLTVRSRPGEGAAFVVDLPAA